MARKSTADPASGGTGATEAGSARMQETASEVADQATRTAEMTASRTMEQLGETLEKVAEAIRDAGQNLREEQPQIATVAETAAGQVEKAATYVREHEPRELVRTAEEAARRQPAAVIGGGLALGFLLGRLLRSTASSATDGGGADGYARGEYGRGDRSMSATGGYRGIEDGRRGSAADVGYGTGYGSGGYASGGYSGGGPASASERGS